MLSSDSLQKGNATVGRPEGTRFVKTDQPCCGNGRVTDSWVKVKVEFNLEQATKAQRGSGDTVIPRLTKIVRSGIKFVRRNVISPVGFYRKSFNSFWMLPTV